MADVVCPSCHGIYHETTPLFDAAKTPNGAMFKAKPIVEERHWWSFSETPSAGPGDLECPQCGTLYVDGGARFRCELKGRLSRAEIPGAGIDESKNETILLMAEQGASMTDIGKVVGASRQAVTARLKALKQEADHDTSQ